MNKALVLVMDLGKFRAFRMETDPTFSRPRLVGIEDRETDVEDRLSQQVTDQAGQFGKGARSFASVNDMSNGERHNIDLEIRRRALRQFADFAKEIEKREPAEAVYLAAGSEINAQVLDALNGNVRNKIQKNLKANLTRARPEEIIERFLH